MCKKKPSEQYPGSNLVSFLINDWPHNAPHGQRYLGRFQQISGQWLIRWNVQCWDQRGFSGLAFLSANRDKLFQSQASIWTGTSQRIRDPWKLSRTWRSGDTWPSLPRCKPNPSQFWARCGNGRLGEDQGTDLTWLKWVWFFRFTHVVDRLSGKIYARIEYEICQIFKTTQKG